MLVYIWLAVLTVLVILLLRTQDVLLDASRIHAEQIIRLIKKIETMGKAKKKKKLFKKD